MPHPAASPSPSDSSSAGPRRPRLRVAVAGLGAVARTAHLPLLERRRDLFQVSALCDLSRSALDDVGTRHGVPPGRRHTSLAQLLAAGGFDALILLTSGSHGADAASVLRAGYPVLCEKPLAFTRAEVREIASAERAAGEGPRLMVGYMKQYDPAAVRLSEVLEDAGGPGAVRSVEVCVLHPTSGDQLAFARLPRTGGDVPDGELGALRSRDDSLVEEALGPLASERMRALYGIVNSSVCHELSLLRQIDGPPEGVDFAAAWADEGEATGSLALDGRLPSGGRYAVRWHFLPGHAAYRETVRVHHEQGSLELAFPSPYLMNAPTVLTETSAVGGGEHRAEFRSVAEAFEEELVAFHAMAVDGVPPRTGTEGAAADVATAQQAVAALAAREGSPCGGEAGQYRRR